MANFISNLFAKDKPPRRQPPKGRVAETKLFEDDLLIGNMFQNIIRPSGEPPQYERINLDNLKKEAVSEYRNLVVNNSTAVSKIVSDYVLSTNRGWKLTPDYTAENTEGTPGQELFDNFLGLLETKVGGFNAVINTISDNLIVHGNALIEFVYDEDGLPSTIKTPNPLTAAFRKRDDPVDGEEWELGQELSRFDFKSLAEFPNVEFIRLFPTSETDNPFGRAPLDAILPSVTFHDRFLRNLNLAVETNTFPAMLYNIIVEKIVARLGDEGADEKEVAKEVDRVAENLRNTLKKLGPGGNLIYTDDVEVGGPISGLGRQNLGMAPNILAEMSREIITGGKSTSLLHNRNDQVAETHARQQLIGYGRFIGAGQEVQEAFYDRQFNLILASQGLPQLARFRFFPANSAEAEQKSIAEDLRVAAIERKAKTLDTLAAALSAAQEGAFIDQTVANVIYDQFMNELREEL